MKHLARTILRRMFPALASLLLLAGCGASGADADKARNTAGGGTETAVQNTTQNAGEAPDAQNAGEAPDAQNAGEAPDTRDAGEAADTAGETENADRPDSLPTVGLVTTADYHYDQDAELMVNRMELTLPVAADETRAAYPALAAALDQYRAESLEASRAAYQEREGVVEEIRAEEELSEYRGFSFYGTETAYIRRADSQAFSAAVYSDEYAGGIHGMYGFTALNLDAVTGEAVSLDSLLSDAGREALNSYLGAELDRLYPELAPGHMLEDFETGQYTFTLEPDGVTFWFSPYEIASYADGCLTAKLYFQRDGELFNGAYAAPESWWCMGLPASVPALFSPDGGASARNVTVWGEYSETGDAYEKLYFELDGPMDSLSRGFDGPGFDGRNVHEEDVYTYAIRPCYCHTPAGEFLMVQTSADNDYEAVNVYSLDDGAALNVLNGTGARMFSYTPQNGEDVTNYSGCRTALTNPLDLPLYTRGDLFGTWTAEGQYVFAPDGLTLNGEYLYLPAGPVLTLKQPLAVRPVSKDNLFFAFDDAVTLDAGTEIRAFAWDGVSTLFFRTDAAAEGVPEGAGSPWGFGLACDDEESWPRTVGGVPEEELFDGLWYVG